MGTLRIAGSRVCLNNPQFCDASYLPIDLCNVITRLLRRSDHGRFCLDAYLKFSMPWMLDGTLLPLTND